MKEKIICLLIIFISSNCVAQKEFNIWYFGHNAGLDFNSGSPVPIAGGMTFTDEGSASIADVNGNLLFYSDGVTVWNNLHATMPNGFGLLGGNSSTQSATIVPVPGIPTQYYIFTTDQQGGPNGVEYSIVDMTLQGGLGDVTVKNVQLLPFAIEGCYASQHPNGSDYWLIAHTFNSTDFYVYQVTAGGILPPVISTIGTFIGTGAATIGVLKASPCGNKIAYANWGTNYFEVYEFNNMTGVISNAINLPSVPSSSPAYGVEFSPDGTILYGSIITPSEIYQWDLNAGSAAAIIASMTLVGTASGNFNGTLQLGPDGKIYLPQYPLNYIGAITDPNTLGVACNFVDQQVVLTSGAGTLGLPGYTGNLWCSLQPDAFFNTPDNHICAGECINFFDLSSNSTSWEWSFPGGSPSTSTDQNPSFICYNTPGVYNVMQIVSNGILTDTLNLANYITVYPATPIPTLTQSGDTLFCSGGYTSYQWFFGSDSIIGATNYFYVATQSGNYNIVVEGENGCAVGAGIVNVIASLTPSPSPKERGVWITINPFNTSTILFVDKKYLQEKVEFEIFDLIGQEVSSIVIKDVKTEIKREGMRSGMYFYKVMSGEKEVGCGRIVVSD